MLAHSMGDGTSHHKRLLKSADWDYLNIHVYEWAYTDTTGNGSSFLSFLNNNLFYLEPFWHIEVQAAWDYLPKAIAKYFQKIIQIFLFILKDISAGKNSYLFNSTHV